MRRNTEKIDMDQVLGMDNVEYVVNTVNREKIILCDASDRLNDMLAPHNRSVSRQSIWNYCNHAGYSPRTVMVKDDFILSVDPDHPGVPPV